MLKTEINQKDWSFKHCVFYFIFAFFDLEPVKDFKDVRVLKSQKKTQIPKLVNLLPSSDFSLQTTASGIWKLSPLNRCPCFFAE